MYFVYPSYLFILLPKVGKGFETRKRFGTFLFAGRENKGNRTKEKGLRWHWPLNPQEYMYKMKKENLFFTLQRGKAHMVFYCQDAGQEDGDRCYELGKRQRDAHAVAPIVDKSPEDAGQRINIFPKDERLLVDKDIPHHPTECSGNGTHDNRHPKGKAKLDRLGDAHDGKQSQPHGIEDKAGIVQPYYILAEYQHEEERQS